jgi:hypothetical protein
MPLNLASPGIVVREVDLTVGRVDPTSNQIGAIVAPFAQGPIDVPTLVENENDLVNVFGKPYETDKHFESWMTASSFLAYGGPLRVVRADDTAFRNAYSGSGSAPKIKSVDHYTELGYDENNISGVTVAARNSGSWANGIRIGIIDAKADQLLTLDSVTDISVGAGVSQAVPSGTIISTAGAGTTSVLDGYYKGIVTEVDATNSKIGVKILTHVSSANVETSVDYTPNGSYRFTDSSIDFPNVGGGTTSVTVTRGALNSTAVSITAGVALTAYSLESSLTLDMPGGESLGAASTVVGIATAGIQATGNHFLQIGNEIISLSGATIGIGQITLASNSRGVESTSASSHADGASVKHLEKFEDVASVVSLSGHSNILASETSIGISTTRTGISSIFNAGGFARVGNQFMGVSALLEGGSTSTRTATAKEDWFDQQTLTIGTVSTGAGSVDRTIKWNTIAERPSTSSYAEARGSRFDEVHVVVIDGDGKITGNTGTILEKHLNLSKAKDAEFSVGSPSYWRKYIKSGSAYIFGGGAPTGIVTTGFSSGYTKFTDGGWDQNAEDSANGPVIFDAIGNHNITLAGGLNYGGKTDLVTTGSLDASLANVVSGYGLLENNDLYDVDFLLMGSGRFDKFQTQALANKLISVAGLRQDSIAFISPNRATLLNDTSDGTATTINSDSVITDNLVDFYSGVNSSSYAVFDSGYKYMYDRFNDVFRYIPLNGDIAGICARNDIDNFPWFSPAGTVRGTILNSVKLAYNPSKIQRDILYSNRINPVIFSPGAGNILFGDKTGLAKASAFDRINVRRLFIYLEDAISAAARDQLFEFNDEITRTNFVNIVEPFLRDVQGKRGIIDYVVICDETNNTAAVIDNNEFVADIFIKPARSINFIGLTFVATRTGVSFEEIVGNV